MQPRKPVNSEMNNETDACSPPVQSRLSLCLDNMQTAFIVHVYVWDCEQQVNARPVVHCKLFSSEAEF